MKQAQQEGVQIEGADPDSDIPIKISNFEYRIPKELVEYIGMQRLETYREKGLELRAQLTAQQGKITELLQVPHSGLPHLSQPCPVCAAHSAPRDTHDTPPALCHAQQRAPNPSPAQP